MSVPPLIEIETVALACQIICFAAFRHPSVSKVNVHTLQTAQQVSSQYPVAIPPLKNQPSDWQEQSAEVEELYLPDWVVDPHIFKQAIASFERATSTLRKNTSSDSSSADKLEEQPHNNTETPHTTSEISRMTSQAEQAEQPGFVWTDQLQAIITEAVHAVLQTDWEAQKHQLDSENLVNRLCQNDLGFFDPYHEGDHDIEFAEKDTYYWNVHSFVKNAQNITDVKGANTVRARLHTCLHGVAMKWYRTQLSDVKRTGLKEGNGINYWKKALINRFKESHSDTLHALQKTWYTLSDARNDRPPASYVYDVVCHVKSLDALTVQAQLTWAYNNLDSDLVKDINESTATTLIMQFIELMKEKRNTWKESLLKHQNKRQPDWGD